jgi:peptidoglycan/xylan/chitin deacetylase (PgdA/CDA1 family)
MGILLKIWSRILRELTYLKRDIGYRLDLDNQFYKNARGNRILIYHGICEHDHTRFNPIFLTAKIFEQHLKLYKKHCHVLSLDDLYNERFSPDKFNICITFDDGYANNHKYVLPLLEKYKMPATFFITGVNNEHYDILWNDFLGIVSKYGPQHINYKGKQYYKGKYDQYISTDDNIALKEQLRSVGFAEKAEMMELLYPLVSFKNDADQIDYWLQMTTEQLKEMAASPFVTVGAHGYYHNDLARISAEDALSEMIRVKLYLETLIGKPVNSIAFPYGSYNQQVINEAKKAGYDQLLIMDLNEQKDAEEPKIHERFTVNPFISPVNQLYATITRKYD